MSQETTTIAPPLLSVIVPVCQGASTLDTVLAALTTTSLPRESWELIVVDDASSDDSALIAARYADRVIRLAGRPRGPAYARNRGFEIARGSIIVFQDADVRIHPDTLERFLSKLAADSSVAAVVGSYDVGEGRGSLITSYRNVLHRYLRLRSAGDVDIFWPACAAIRRMDFVAVGLFDEWHYWRPQAEGVELGHRLRTHGRRIVLDPGATATHLKRWTLRHLLVVDLFLVGIPWMRLLIQEKAVMKARAPSLLASERTSTALTGISLLCAVGTLLRDSRAWPAIGILSAMAMLLTNIGFFRYAARELGLWFAAATVPLHVLHYVANAVAVGFAWLLHETVGEPQRDASEAALAEVGAKMWPPVPQRRTSDAWQ